MWLRSVISAPSINADGSPAASRCCSVPSVAAATGTPSCAADNTAKRQRLTEQPADTVRHDRADPEANAEQDQPRVLAEFAHLQ